MQQQGSTLVGTERRLAAPTLVFTGILTVLGAWLLVACPHPVLALVWLLPTCSNALFLIRHRAPSVGMIPVALASLVPATLAGLIFAEPGGVLFVCCAVGLVVSALVTACFLAWFARLARVCYRPRPLESDAIVIVLGCKVIHGLPSKTLVQRLNIAARLCDEHPGLRLVLTGGALGEETYSEAEVMERFLVERGIAHNRLLVEPKARNTHENIAYALEVIRTRGFLGQLCVLSSDYHLWRAVHEGQTQGVELVPLAAATPLGSLPQQWSREVLTIWFGRA